MAANHRTPQQRDKRLARVRRATQVTFIAAAASSGVIVAYAANLPKSPVVTIPTTTVPTTTVPTTTTTSPPPTTQHGGGVTTTRPPTTTTPPTTVPVTTTTTCYSTPSGNQVCY